VHRPQAPPSRTAERFHPPQFLLAYARALFNLGWRYETAVGSKRNLEEAARCYQKAARLSVAAAEPPIAFVSTAPRP
jgi:TPR repeat protein